MPYIYPGTMAETGQQRVEEQQQAKKKEKEEKVSSVCCDMGHIFNSNQSE